MTGWAPRHRRGGWAAGIRRRVGLLEARAAAVPEAGEVSPLAAEVREIDRHIAALEAQIAEIEGRMEPEELALARREEAAFDARLEGLSPDEQAALIDAAISELEAAQGGEGLT